jgi:hypothetical protein
LQTLLKEMSIIEEANDQMAKELEGEKSKHDNTKDQLETSSQIIQQLEIKIEMQEKQLAKLQQLQFESSQKSSEGLFIRCLLILCVCVCLFFFCLLENQG